jgi:hypothetical protein
VSLCANYSRYGVQTQAIISTLAISGVGELIAKNMDIDDALLSILLKSDNVLRDQKISLFTTAIPKLSEEICQTHFNELGFSDLCGIFTKNSGRRNYSKSAEVTKILDVLKENGRIYEYHDDERNSEKYCIIKNKPKGKGEEILD